MTHVLVNPGYSLHRRARTVDDDLLASRHKHNRRKLTESELNHIRSESRRTWLGAWEDPGKPAVKNVYDWQTTYSSQHDFKQLSRPTKTRPTSPTRRNNPHPPGVFLRLRILKDKGYPSCPHPKSRQNPYEGKYVYDTAPIPDDTMYYTLKDIKRLERDRQTELLRKIMNPTAEKKTGKTCFQIPRNGRNISPGSFEENDGYIAEMSELNSCEPRVVPSLHRWLKCAGKEEREKMNNLKKNMWLKDSRFKTVDPNRYLLRTYDSVPEVKIHRPYRRDFGIHPELWTK